jgi:hypothetical protein
MDLWILKKIHFNPLSKLLLVFPLFHNGTYISYFSHSKNCYPITNTKLFRIAKPIPVPITNLLNNVKDLFVVCFIFITYSGQYSVGRGRTRKY